MKRFHGLLILLLAISCSKPTQEHIASQVISVEDSTRIAELKQKWRKSLYQTPDSIKSVAEEMISFGKEKGNTKALVSGNNMLAGYYSRVGDIERALSIQEENLIINGDDLEGLANIYTNIGNYHTRSGDYDLALEAQLKGLQAEEERNHLEGISISLLNIAGVYAHLDEDEKTLEFASRAFRLANENAFLPVKMQSAFQLAETNVKKGLDSLALIFADSVIRSASKLRSEFGVNKGRSIQAKAYANQGELEKALELIRQVRSFYAKNRITSENLLQAITESEFLTKLGLYAESEKVMEEALTMAFELEGKEEISRVYYQLALSQEFQKKTSEALSNYKQYYTYQDSLINAEKNKAIEDIATKYETEKKEAKIQALSQEKEIQDLKLRQQRFGLIGLGGVLILFVGGGVLVARQRKLREEQRLTEIELKETKKRLEVEQQFRASELKAIRSQMNPHFVFNALNSIQEYIMSNERKLAGKYLGKFADLMRVYLNHSQVRIIPISEEIDALKLYMELESLRFEDSLKYEIKVGDTVDSNNEIPSLLLQPYVENAFKHGLLHKNGDRFLKVMISQKQDELTIEVEDNGVGRQKSAEINQLRNPQHMSFASEATRNRLALLNKDRSSAITENIEDLVDPEGECLGTKVVIKIPIEP